MIDRTLLRNILLLAACQGMLLCNGVTLIAVNGLVGRQLAPTPTLATLTITGYVIGAALLTLPASRFMRRFARDIGSQQNLIAGNTVLLIQMTLKTLGNYNFRAL